MEILFFIFLICFFTLAVTSISFAPWVPARDRDLKRIFKLADLKQSDVFYDLGCGDGRVVFYANKHFGAKAIGVELAIPFFLFCKIKNLFYKNRKNVFFKYKNLFKEDLCQADVVYVFGMPKAIQKKVIAKFEKELKAGARVISYTFAFSGWTPKKIDKPTDKDLSIYLYEI